MEQYPDETMMLLITNAKDYPVTFLLEPWGEYYEMGAGQQFTLVIEGAPNPPEIVCTENEIYYWEGPDTNVRLYHGNREIGGPIRTRTPNLPTGPLRAILGSP